MIITRISPFSGEKNSMDLPITQEQIDSFNRGTLVQVAFPNLTPGQREFILTGITEKEWNDTFKSENKNPQ